MMSADVAYLDTSAVVKLLVREGESAALRRELRRWPRRASANLIRVELLRAAKRAGLPRLASPARRYLGAINLIRLDDALLDRAAEVDPSSLRSLDAIHLASALALGDDLGVVITYDDRMLDGAAALGLPVASPR
jgi:predicted nucleic acid-binding protein